MILVTGAGGFIGRQLCARLLGSGKSVLAVDRCFDAPLACPTLCGDLTDTAFLDTLFERQDVEQVAHLYGLSKRFVELIGEERRRSGLEFVSVRIPIVVGAGARSAASRWRSDLFQAPSPAEPIRIPFDADELLPLVHVEDAGAMLAVLLSASEVPDALYNMPAESWTGRRLRAELEQLLTGVAFEFGTARVDGIPQALDSGRFIESFAFTPTSIRSHLQRAFAS